MLVNIYLRTGPPTYAKKMIDRSIDELGVLHDKIMTVHIELTWIEAIKKSFNGFRIDPNKYYVRRVRGSCGEPPHTLTEPISILMSEFKKIGPGKKGYTVQIMSFDEKIPFSSVDGRVRNDLGYRECEVRRTYESVEDDDFADETENVASWEETEGDVETMMSQQELDVSQVNLSRPPPPVYEYQNRLTLQQRNSRLAASQPNSIPEQVEDQVDPDEVKARFLERAKMMMTNSQLLQARNALLQLKNSNKVGNTKWSKWVLKAPEASTILRILFDV